MEEISTLVSKIKAAAKVATEYTNSIHVAPGVSTQVIPIAQGAAKPIRVTPQTQPVQTPTPQGETGTGE